MEKYTPLTGFPRALAGRIFLEADIRYLADVVRTWPADAEGVRLDADGEVCFTPNPEHNFFPGDRQYGPGVDKPPHPCFVGEKKGDYVSPWKGAFYSYHHIDAVRRLMTAERGKHGNDSKK